MGKSLADLFLSRDKFCRPVIDCGFWNEVVRGPKNETGVVTLTVQGDDAGGYIEPPEPSAQPPRTVADVTFCS